MHLKSEISDFFDERNIFVTGATGFMGKVLVEKLLRSCKKIGTIFILMRPKKGKNIRERIEEIINSKVFSRIKESVLLEKVVAIPGDVTEENLGINENDEKTLIEKVSIVFHCAASVKFDEPLRQSLVSNFLGTKRVLDLCHKMKNIETLVHTSTAYSNCDRDEIDEIIYPPYFPPSTMLNCLELFDEDFFNLIAPKIIGKKPNNYVFAKSIAESFVQEKKGELPVAIFRPSIIMPSSKEPMPGWLENHNGPIGTTIAHGCGLIRTFPVHVNKVADLMPVDFSANMCIAVAWYTATYRPESLLVYNNTSGNINPITWKEYEQYVFTHITRNPTVNTVWYPTSNLLVHPNIFQMYNGILHRIPAKIGDFILKFLKRKPFMMRLYENVMKTIKFTLFFTTHEFKFHSDNVFNLINAMTPEDRENFNFDMRTINWDTYWSHAVMGVNKYMHKMDIRRTIEARKRLKLLFWLHQILKSFIVSLIVIPIIRLIRLYRQKKLSRYSL